MYRKKKVIEKLNDWRDAKPNPEEIWTQYLAVAEYLILHNKHHEPFPKPSTAISRDIMMVLRLRDPRWNDATATELSKGKVEAYKCFIDTVFNALRSPKKLKEAIKAVQEERAKQA